ncbi:MAG: beta-ketoacyl-ACP synthase II [Rhodospirillaceae bacterium]|nr:beta-ketoacyl-ACP synthase II [Rhodospirillaceae bacterium]MDD9996209.1 beta-ketoacyl-ACP synthase II [Rhodospirillaceae bacterium]MDE0360479.1 beta-ketoacyl-ACP synthase II [Rhodospirillaceae bacterium]
MTRRRVVVTGLGLISPTGNNVAQGWANVRDGVSGIGPVDSFDTTGFSTTFAGVIRDFDVTEYMSVKDSRKADRFMHYGIAACTEAFEDAGLTVPESEAHRFGVIMGSGIGGIDTIETNYEKYKRAGARRISPFFVPGSIVNMISGHVSIKYGLTGLNLALVTACATSAHCIGLAGRLISIGEADVILAGGAEYATTPLGIGGFASARALSTRNDDPAGASRPWDRDRDGFVLSDGAGCLVLEDYERARRRGANIYAELIGSAMNGDAYHITAPTEDGSGADHCMRLALEDAGVNAEDVDYVNAHGTSTPLGDIAETLAVKRTFGEHAKSLVISSTKSTTGHTLGAAGAIEALFTVMAIREGVVPPTINLENQDPECDLYYTPNEALERDVRIALSNSFGFGGTNGTLVFRQID